MKNKNKTEEFPTIARDEMVYYQRSANSDGGTRMISQKTIDEECISLEESKKRMTEKIHNHFRNL